MLGSGRFSVLVRNSWGWEMVSGLSEVTQLANQSFKSKPPDNQLWHFPESLSPETASSPSPFSGSHFSKILFGSHHIPLQKLAVAFIYQGSVGVHGSALRETWQRQAVHWPCVSCQLSRVLGVCLGLRHWVGPNSTIF